MHYKIARILLWAFIMIINLLKVQNLWKSKPRERKNLLKKKAKRLAKEGPKKEDTKASTLDTSEPITLDFLTNPNKE